MILQEVDTHYTRLQGHATLKDVIPLCFSLLTIIIVFRRLSTSPCASPTCYVSNDLFVITSPKDSQRFLWRGWFITVVREVFLGADVDPNMPRDKSKVVPGCYDPVPHDDYKYSRLTMEKSFRIVAEELDKSLDR